MLGFYTARIYFPDDEPGVPTDVMDTGTRTVPVIEMFAGVSYERQFGEFLVRLAAGFEVGQWFNILESRLFTDSHMEAMNAHMMNDLGYDSFFVRGTVEF